MGSAKDSSPHPIRSSGPKQLNSHSRSDIASPTTLRPLETRARNGAKIPPLSPVPPGVRPPGQQPKLLDRLSEALRPRHYSPRTEQTYRHWVKRFIFFHHVRHPNEMAEPEINAFLTHLAVQEKVSASTQNQALSALLFLYRYVLDRPLGRLGEVVRARKPHWANDQILSENR